MVSLGGGKSSGSSSSQGQSTSYSNSNASSFGNSINASGGVSSSGQEIWDAQSPYLNDLYKSGSELTGQAGGIAQDYIDKYSGNVDSAITGSVDTSYLDSIRNGSNLGMQTLQSSMNPTGNPYLEGQINNMRTNAADNMNIFGMSDNRSNANMSGQFGSSRQGIDDYLLRKETMKQAGDQENAMRMNAYDTDQNRAVDAAGNYINAGVNANSGMQDQYGNVINNVNSGYNLNMNPNNANWNELQNLSGIVGGPTTLNNSNSSSFGYGNSTSGSNSVANSGSQSTNSSTGKNSAWNVSGSFGPK